MYVRLKPSIKRSIGVALKNQFKSAHTFFDRIDAKNSLLRYNVCFNDYANSNPTFYRAEISFESEDDVEAVDKGSPYHLERFNNGVENIYCFVCKLGAEEETPTE